jgi:AraC-like DNA-binding protein
MARFHTDGAGRADSPSILEQLMDTIRCASGCELSFEDLTGITFHAPAFKLPDRLKIHTCAACLHAKSTPRGQGDCMANKVAVNRIALRRRRVFTGMCHVGLNEIVAPLSHQGIVIGVFYFGSVLVQETEQQSFGRLKKYCQRRGLDTASFRKAFNASAKISTSEFARLQSHIDLLLRVATVLVEQSGLPVSRYKSEPGSHRLRLQAIPPFIQAAARYIDRNHGNAMTLQDLADHLHCSPSYLSRSFSRYYPEGISGYLRRVRLDHAVKLIQLGTLSMGEIAFLVGFEDQSYFTKVFRQVYGKSPGQFRLLSPPPTANETKC